MDSGADKQENVTTSIRKYENFYVLHCAKLCNVCEADCNIRPTLNCYSSKWHWLVSVILGFLPARSQK